MNKLTLPEYFDAFRVETSLKITVSGIICILVNNIFHFDLGYLSALFLFLILVLAHGEALNVGSQTILGVLISGTITLLITFLFIDSKVLYIILMACWIFLCMTFVNRYFLPTLLSAIAATMTMYAAIYISVPAAASSFHNYLLQLFLAVIVCWVIDGIVWPHRSRGAFQLTLKTVYEEFSELFNEYAGDRSADRKNHESISTSLITFSNLATYVLRMEREERGKEFPIDLYMKIINYTRGIYIRAEVLEEYILKEHSFMKDARVERTLDQVLNIISESFSIIAGSIGTKSILNVRDKELGDSLLSLHELYRTMHEAEGMEEGYYEDLHAFGAMLPVLEGMAGRIRRIVDAINIFHSDRYSAFLEDRVTRSGKVEELRSKSFFDINSETSKVGIKTVIIFMLLLVGERVLGLPGEAQVAFYAILFGIIPNLGQAYMKSRYGIIGVLSGLCFGLVSLVIVSRIPHFLIFLSLYCLGTFTAAYFANSSKDISAAGLQAGLIVPYSLLFNTGPQVDLDSSTTRVLALLSAAFIALIVHHLLWPMNPYSLLKRKISQAIVLTGQILSRVVMPEFKDSKSVDKLVLPLAATLPTSTALLHDAEYIVCNDELHGEEFMHIIESVERIYADVETMKRTIYQNTDSELFRNYLEHMRAIYEKVCGMFKEISGQFDSEDDYRAQISLLRDEIQKRRTEFREAGAWRTAEPEEVERIVLIGSGLDNLIDSLNEISISISEINQGESADISILRTKEAYGRRTNT